MRLRVRLATLSTTEPAKAIAVFSKAGATRLAVRAVHSYLGFDFRLHDSIIHEALRVFKR